MVWGWNSLLCVQVLLFHTLPGGLSGGEFCILALLADELFWDVSFADLGAGQVDPSETLAALNHWSSRERLHTEARDQLEGIFI